MPKGTHERTATVAFRVSAPLDKGTLEDLLGAITNPPKPTPAIEIAKKLVSAGQLNDDDLANLVILLASIGLTQLQEVKGIEIQLLRL